MDGHPGAISGGTRRGRDSDSAILNFALNLEYLEAEFHSHAVHGEGLPEDMTHGSGQRGPVEGGREVGFQSRAIRQFAAEIARDEYEHVAFFRSALPGLRGRGADPDLPERLLIRAIATAVCEPLCGSIPIITAAINGSSSSREWETVAACLIPVRTARTSYEPATARPRGLAPRS